MIGRLHGTILVKQPPFMMLDVGGVGYELEVPMSTFYDLPEVGGSVTLFTHMAVRDDAHVLYGFGREADRMLFRSLLKVSGVGGKMALAILSGMSSEQFSLCVQAGDTAALTRLPGVGKKTAERLIMEMRDRLDAQAPAHAGGRGGSAPAVAAPSPESEAVSALVALGYKSAEAARMTRAVSAEGMASEDIIRAALQGVAPRSEQR
ncbi:MAG: Holliday junction branch migration protein RuvA [Pseudomonadota bacterium]